MSKATIYYIGFLTLALIAAIETYVTNEPNTSLLGLGIIALMMFLGEKESATSEAKKNKPFIKSQATTEQ